MQHAEKVKALNAAEAELEQVRQQLEAAAKSKADLEGEVAGLKAEVVAINAAHKSAKAEAEARAKELSAHNAELHNQLEKLAQDTQKVWSGSSASFPRAPTDCCLTNRAQVHVAPQCLQGQSSTEESSGQGSASSMAEVVKYLRREKETAECQLALLQQESARWQQQAAIAEKAAAQVRQPLALPHRNLPPFPSPPSQSWTLMLS